MENFTQVSIHDGYVRDTEVGVFSTPKTTELVIRSKGIVTYIDNKTARELHRVLNEANIAGRL